MTNKNIVHFRESIVHKSEHLINTANLFVREILLARYSTVLRSSNVVAGIANAFEFGYFAKHSPYLILCFVAQMGVAHSVEIFGYFDFHVVGYAFVFFYSRE